MHERPQGLEPSREVLNELKSVLRPSACNVQCLRESDPEFHEFAVKTEISDFFISGQEKPFGDLFTKITIKLSKEFLFSRNSAKREMPYLQRSRHEILLRFGVFSKRSWRKAAQCTEMIF